jgi:mannose-6-phosphate isomerase-like protein (cupin superfamily)
MVSNVQKLVMVKPRAKTCYERWMEREGVPIVERFGVSDVQGLSLGRWNRLGCDGAYLQFRGMDGVTGAYLGKISGGTMTEPENHLYEKVIYIIEGEGVAEFQQRGRVPQSISWKTGSLFSAPLNATHRLINHSKKPAFFLAVTTAPMILDHFHNEQFVFNSEFAFSDRYDGEDDYFNVGEQRYLAANNPQWVCETNFIPDACKAALDGQRQKRAGVKITQLEIAKNTLVGQFAEWPVGRYHKAQDHGGGGVVVILRSQGYSLMWPKEWGTRPYEEGHGERVVRINWQAGSIFSPPTNWYHQHFNTGTETAVPLALRCESHKFPLGMRVAPVRADVHASVKTSETLINYEDEDPEIRRAYDAELAKRGIVPDMNYAAAGNQD